MKEEKCIKKDCKLYDVFGWSVIIWYWISRQNRKKRGKLEGKEKKRGEKIVTTLNGIKTPKQKIHIYIVNGIIFYTVDKDNL